MKNILSTLFLLLIFIPTIASAKFKLEGTNQELIAIESNNSICLAKIDSNKDELEILNHSPIERPEFRKAMRSTTYANRVLLSFASTPIFLYSPPSAPFLATIFTAGITSIFDDHSHLAGYGLLPFGIGERVMRGVRIDNLITKNSSFEINEKRFNKIMDIVPTLSAKPYGKCTADSFKAKYPSIQNFTIVE